MTSITLLGTRLAEPGQEFVFEGAAPGCSGCPYRDQCLNLTEGVKYRVTELREGAQTLECAVHADGVRAVEVEPAPVTATIPDEQAYAGSRASIAGPCPHTSCPSYEYCLPDGAAVGESHRVENVLGEPPHEHCHLDRDLTLVEFGPAEE